MEWKSITSKNIILVLLVSLTWIGATQPTWADMCWNLLEGYVDNASDFIELEIGNKIVYWQQRMLGEAIVERDYIVYHFDKDSLELVDMKQHWREDLPAVLPELKITREEAEAMVKSTVEFSRLYIISPESDVFPIMPTPGNPCWVVESVENNIITVTVIDAVESTIAGYGIPPPYTAFSLTGPSASNPCSGSWTPWARNARNWFNTMGYDTEYVVWPTESKVKSHIQSNRTAMFYELAHGGSTSFASGCVNGQSYEYTYASEIETWIADYYKMPFAFIGSCGGMCNTGDNTLSYEFRKGSTEETTTVGYCGMAGADCSTYCWGYTILWQTALFTYMDNGDTVKEAFDQANADYPGCAAYDCMRFEGDEDFAVVPVVKRVPLDDVDKFYIKNSLGDPVAWLGDLGNVVLKGTLTQGKNPQATGHDEFRFQDSEDDDVAIIDTTDGKMYIKGTLKLDSEGNWVAPTDGDNNFRIQDSGGNDVAYISKTGDLYLKGELYEDAEP